MIVVDNIKKTDNTKILSFVSGKNFRNDQEFLDTIEDFLFGKILKDSDESNFVSRDEIFKKLNENIGK